MRFLVVLVFCACCQAQFGTWLAGKTGGFSSMGVDCAKSPFLGQIVNKLDSAGEFPVYRVYPTGCTFPNRQVSCTPGGIIPQFTSVPLDRITQLLQGKLDTVLKGSSVWSDMPCCVMNRDGSIGNDAGGGSGSNDGEIRCAQEFIDSIR